MTRLATPTIKTQRLTLAPYFAGHVSPAHVAWLNDPEVVKYSEQRHKRHTLKSEQEFVNDMASSANDHIWGIDGIHDCAGGEVPVMIGIITAHIDPNNQVANMGIMIGNKDYWGKGFGLEAWKGVMNWLFENGIRKVEAGCHFQNKAMRKIATRSGMSLEGVRHDHFMVNGEPQHLLLYGKTKPQTVKVEIDVQANRNTGT